VLAVIARLPHARGQVGEEAPQLIQGVVLVGGHVVHGTGARLGPRAAQLLLVGCLAHGRRHDGRSGHEQLRGPLDDHREVGGHDARGSQPRHRAERRSHHGDARQVGRRELEAGHERDVGEAHVLERLHAAAAPRPVDQADQRQAQIVRHPLGVDHLLPDRGVGRSAADGEVVALDDRAAAVDPPLADHHVGGKEVLQVTVCAVGGLARQLAGLVEAAFVEEAADSLAHIQLAAGVLAGNALLAPHPSRQPLTPPKVFQLGLPGHAR